MSSLLAVSNERRRNAALLAASVALHVLVLTPLALRWIAHDPLGRLEPPWPPIPTVVQFQIEPRPLFDEERLQPHSSSIPEIVAPPVDAANPNVIQTPLLRTPEDEEDQALPSPPMFRLPAAPPAGAPAPPAEAERWRVRPNDTPGRVAQSLRNSPVGCRLVPGLTAAERAACDQEFGQAASEAPPLEGTGNAARDARFAREGAAALARYEARRRPLSGGVGVVGASPDCPGGNLRGSCAGAHLPEHYQHREHDVRQTRPPN